MNKWQTFCVGTVAGILVGGSVMLMGLSAKWEGDKAYINHVLVQMSEHYIGCVDERDALLERVNRD